MIKRLVLFSLSCSLAINSQAAKMVTLDSLILKAEKHYPMTAQGDVLMAQLNATLENFTRNFWPQVQVLGQYTYQSDVTGLPIKIPNMTIPELDKNQYRVYADIQQTVYDGGVTKSGKSISMATTEVEKEKLNIELYKLREKVTQLYFGILMVNERKSQLELSKLDIKTALDKMETAYTNGIVLEATVSSLKAEWIKLEQKIIEADYEGSAYRKMLSVLTGELLDTNDILKYPETGVNDQNNRPELRLIDKQLALLYTQESMLNAKIQPKVSLFLQAGFGKPALNMLSNETQGYYIGGLRFSIPLSAFYTRSNDKQMLNLQRNTLEFQRNTFLMQADVQLVMEDEEIKKFKQLIEKDEELIALRTSIKTSAFIQLSNGTITSADYIREQNAEESARLAKVMHQLQLLLHIYNKQIIKGN